jgi:hypothetical protein
LTGAGKTELAAIVRIDAEEYVRNSRRLCGIAVLINLFRLNILHLMLF